MSEQFFGHDKHIVKDGKAKSLSYNCLADIVRIDRKMVAHLKELARSSDGPQNARISLHGSPDHIHHEMIVLHHRHFYYRPHKHLTKGESCKIIEGALVYYVFNDVGNIADSYVLNAEGEGLIYRLEEKTWHSSYPISEYAIFLESKPGPYLGEGDSLFPEWAPDGSDEGAGIAYMERLLETISKQRDRA